MLSFSISCSESNTHIWKAHLNFRKFQKIICMHINLKTMCHVTWNHNLGPSPIMNTSDYEKNYFKVHKSLQVSIFEINFSNFNIQPCKVTTKHIRDSCMWWIVENIHQIAKTTMLNYAIQHKRTTSRNHKTTDKKKQATIKYNLKRSPLQKSETCFLSSTPHLGLLANHRHIWNQIEDSMACDKEMNSDLRSGQLKPAKRKFLKSCKISNRGP
jgi:hypothetical protein